MKDILERFSVIGIIGLAKNAGKTTTLNKIIEIYPNIKIGLTSIGLDGEPLDQVHFFAKPEVKVRPGMLIATTYSCLESSEVKWELIEKTSHQTPLGVVMIVEIMTEGKMMIAGPSTNQELNQVVHVMKKHCDKVLIDGAFNRLTFSNIDVMEGIVLAAGASFHPDLDVTLKQTSDLIRLFSSKKTLFMIKPDVGIALYKDQHMMYRAEKKLENLEALIEQSNHQFDAIYIGGAVTSKMIDAIIQKGMKSFVLIMDDPSKWMASQRHMRALNSLDIHIEVIKSYPIIMVTINPFRIDGHHYDASIMMQRFEKEINIPIFNVKGETSV